MKKLDERFVDSSPGVIVPTANETLPDGTDLYDIRVPGVYLLYGAYTYLNAPAGLSVGGGYLEVRFVHFGVHIIQLTIHDLENDVRWTVLIYDADNPGESIGGWSEDKNLSTTATGAQLTELTDGSETLLHSHAGGGGGGAAGPWELVSTQTVAGAAVQEILWTGLDFNAYDYAVEGTIDTPSLPGTNNLRWYAVEANAGSVITGDYQNSMWRLSVALADAQTAGNYLTYDAATTAEDIFLKAVFSRFQDGHTHMYSDVSTMYNAIGIITTSRARNWNRNSTAVPTKIGIYYATGAFIGVGSSLSLSRRAK